MATSNGTRMQQLGYRAPGGCPGARPARARRIRLGRAHRDHHPQPAARRQRGHHRPGGTAHRDPRDDQRTCVRPRGDPHERRRSGVLVRRRAVRAQGDDPGGVAPPAPGVRPGAVRAASVSRRSSARSTGWRTAAGARWRSAPTSSSPATTPCSASRRRWSGCRRAAARPSSCPASSRPARRCRC